MSPDGPAGLNLSQMTRTIIAGVAAAPEPMVDADRWLDLIDPETRAGNEETLKQALQSERRSQASDPMPMVERLQALRQAMRAQGLSAFIVPKADEHQGEYIAARAERLAWLTGFTGSAGMACVTLDRAAIFVDGRYTLQVQDEVESDAFDYRHVADEPLDAWIKEQLGSGDVLGFDPWLTTKGQVRRWQNTFEDQGISLKGVAENPVDQIWARQPPKPMAPVTSLPLETIWEPSDKKRDRVSETLTAAGLDAYVLTEPASIAWLLNVRGGDVPFTPLPLSFAILYATGTVDWFISKEKLHPDVRKDILSADVRAHDPDSLPNALKNWGEKKARVGVSNIAAPWMVTDCLTRAGATVVDFEDPVSRLKACKGTDELQGMRDAHIRDGASLTRFLFWLSQNGPSGEITEIAAADYLENCRRPNARFQGLSFPTISGAGPNGAIVHYRVSPDTNRLLEPGSLYLVDSGAQYLDGTTDVTRTVAIGEPTDDMRRVFTLVLKGHIALASAVFPVGTTGSQLDILARQALWRAGLDYDHGTGHGVGTFLSVHEGPQRISKVGNKVALEPGMVISNEPGYYREGSFGIRIENLVAVGTFDPPDGAERPLLHFETLTLAPIDQSLIKRELLSVAEIDWLNDYHRRVFQAISPNLDAEATSWLERSTAAID